MLKDEDVWKQSDKMKANSQCLYLINTAFNQNSAPHKNNYKIYKNINLFCNLCNCVYV